MARAKRTDRAEARRRHRAELAAEAAATEAAESAEADDEEEDVEAAPQSSRRPAKPAPRPPSGPAVDASGRLVPVAIAPQQGFFGAMRAAYLPWDVPGDLKLVRPLVTRTHAIWIPALLAVVAGAFMASHAVVGSPWLYAFVSFVLISPTAPAMAGPFIAGVLTPRAGWLAGLIATLIAYAVSLLITATGNMLLPATGPNGEVGLVAVPPQSTLEFARDSLLLIPFGLLVGAFAAWYKRFLALSSPKRPQKAPAKASQRSGSRPRPTNRPGTASRRPR